MKLTIVIADTKDEDGDFMAHIVEHAGLTAFGPTWSGALKEIATVLIGVAESPECMERFEAEEKKG